MNILSALPKARLSMIAALFLALGCVSVPTRAQDAVQNPPGRVGRLALIDGTVSYHTADQNYWQAARRNYPITTGQAFWTEPRARAALDVGSNRIYLDSSTELDISALDDQATQFSLPQGAVFVALRSLAPNSPYEVDIARGVVTLAGLGRYQIVAGDAEHDSQVTVIDGSAHVTGSGVDLELRSGETAVLSGEQAIHGEVGAASPPDAFAAWVEAQEQRHRPDAPAVASAMTGAAELGAYGRWARGERYGDVWYPEVPAGWAPYRNGYWGWVEPWGWTWLDDENWGFAPFHYGRWLMIDDRWAWMPGDETIGEPIIAIFAPALVTFFATQDACAWVPLGPDEIYVPPYPVSLGYFQKINAAHVRNIRNLRNIGTQQTSIDRYVNRRAVTAMPRSAMSGSQRVASAAQPALAARLADARPVLRTSPVRPTAATAGVSPSVARRFGIAQAPGGAPVSAGRAQARAPGPPIREVHPTATARLAPPRAPGLAVQNATPQAPQQPRQGPALARPGATHHLPGSPVEQPGTALAHEPGTAAVSPNASRPLAAPMPEPRATTGQAPPRAPAAAPARPTPPPAVARPTSPPAAARTPQPAPAARAAPPPATVGRAPPRAPAAAPARPTPPPAVARTPQPAPAARAAPPPATVGRAPPRAAPPPPAAHPSAPPAAPAARPQPKR
jgi:hypothetical protein